jgi:hypothetical protein
MPQVRALAILLLALFVVLPARPVAQPVAPETAPQPTLSRAQMEAFLLKARIVRTRGAGKGITNTVRATLSDGTLTHDASIQIIDDSRREFVTNRGTELNFRDSWQFNMAAYLLDKLLAIDMIPATVERPYKGRTGSFTWWVDDVLMDEGARLKSNTQPPNAQSWNEQLWVVRVFDQLIYNTDRNLGNLLIDKSWRVWMIDHSRAFRWQTTLRSPGNLTRIDRQLLARLQGLDKPTLQRELRPYLGGNEIDGLLARRDAIVAHFTTLGEAALYDRRRPAASE